VSFRVLVLTCLPRDYASRCLSTLVATPGIEVVGAILAHGGTPGRSERGKKWRKAFRIGFLGALNGIRMRDWFRDLDAPDLEAECRRLGVPFHETPFLNGETTRELFRAARADIGLSLGNGYIGESVYSIPRLGMLNIHTEILPRFQGGLGVLWPIHEGIPETGFTIHRVARKLDAGDIVHQERYPIAFGRTLEATVRATMAIARERVPRAFAETCANLDARLAAAIPQRPGRTYTTPTFREFLRMRRNHRRLRDQASRSPVDR
jgi:methionyl-tRNA formyltransferase